MPLKVDQCWLFVADNDEGEGLVGARGPDGSWAPFVCADQDRVDTMRQMAQLIADQTGNEIRVLRFHKMELLETIKPRPKRYRNRSKGKTGPN